MSAAFDMPINKLEANVVKAKLMVALRYPESVESLMTIAVHLSSGMDAELVVLYVVEVPPATPLEADDEVLDREGKEVLVAARRVAERYSKKISTELVRAREAGEAITGEAKDQGVELLIIGHRRPHPNALTELLLGSTVLYVAHHAPCRVIIHIPPPKPR
jgi:nucleotide-binding universal stress UspA family protein